MIILNFIFFEIKQMIIKLSFLCHTDNVAMAFGNRYRNNWDLSSARAASVADYLQERGSLAPGSMVVKGLADTQPVADNDTAQGRSVNRRIEIVIAPN